MKLLASMKTLLLLLSLSAVAAGQQAKPAGKCVEGATRKEVSCPKPHKRKPSVKTFTVHCLKRGCGKWDKGYQLFSDPCDGISCVGPVEMMPQKWCLYGCLDKATLDLFSTECTYTKEGAKCNHVAPDKAAVSVEPTNLAILDAPNGSQAIMLTSSEYSHLQQLRAAVVEEEKRLAVKYGASIFGPDCDIHGACFAVYHPPSDHYEFHGQFLLIDKGGK